MSRIDATPPRTSKYQEAYALFTRPNAEWPKGLQQRFEEAKGWERTGTDSAIELIYQWLQGQRPRQA